MQTFRAREVVLVNGSRYEFGSVFEMAVEYNSCPMELFAQCIERGHETHWLIPLCTVIDDSRSVIDVQRSVDVGDTIRFLGKTFIVEPRPSQRLHLRMV